MKKDRQEGKESLFWESDFVEGLGGVGGGEGQRLRFLLRNIVIKEESSGLGCGWRASQTQVAFLTRFAFKCSHEILK